MFGWPVRVQHKLCVRASLAVVLMPHQGVLLVRMVGDTEGGRPKDLGDPVVG